MKTFKDNEGREWTVAINVDVIKRVRGLLDVNLLEIVEGKLIERLVSDPVLLCDIVYVACKPQADERGVTDEQFGRAMAGDAIEQATRALLGDLVNFSPNQRDRKNLQRMIDAAWSGMDKARDLIGARLESGELEKVVEQALANASASSGSAPESPGSTPDG